jgi:hypothetical protein
VTDIGWLILGLAVGAIWLLGAFYVIIEWVLSDARPDARRPWRRRRGRPPDEKPPRSSAP